MAVGERLKYSLLDSSAALAGSRWAWPILSHILTCYLNETNWPESSFSTQTEGNTAVAHMQSIRSSFELLPSKIKQ